MNFEELKEKLKEKQKNCEHTGEVYERGFTKKGIQRVGMYCKKCGALLDYYPQYDED